jgi:hypothetical protein
VACADLSSSSTAYANVCGFQYLLRAMQQRAELRWELIDHTRDSDMVLLNLIL